MLSSFRTRAVPFSSGLLLSLLFAWGCGDKERPPVLGVGQGVPAPNVPHERLPVPSSDFEESACQVIVPDYVTQCGTVTVPVSAGSDETIELHVVRVFTDANNPKTDPVIYLDGGPGAASTESVDYLHAAFLPMAPDRDFIFFDQRGTGASTPRLDCTEGGSIESALNKCFARLSDAIDLAQVNSRNNAADVDALRQALGYEKVNLLGISYGTRLGLTVMRDFPEGVRSAVLDAVVPLQEDLLGQVGLNGYQALERVFQACADDADCSMTYPDPLGELTKLVADLNDEPYETSSYFVDGNTVLGVIFNLIYSPDAIGLMPLMIHQMATGDFSLFQNLEPYAGGGGLAFGMHLSLHCSEEIPFSSREAFEAFDAQVDPALRAGLTANDYFEYCKYWPVPVAPASENEAVLSDIPALVMAGEFDPITPARFSEEVSSDLRNSQYFYLQGQSHGASVSSCGRQLVKQFIDAPTEQVEGACLENAPGIEFESQAARSSSHRVFGRVNFADKAPDADELQQVIDDLRRRLR